MTPEERRKRMEERMASMTPEERERFQARMKEREAQGGGRGAPGGQPGAGGQPGQPGFGGRGGQGGGRNANANPAQAGRTGPGGPANAPTPATIAGTRTTIDSLFGPLQTTETRGRAWLYENKQLKSVRLRLGVSDGTFSEIVDGELKEGQEVVINMLTGLEPSFAQASRQPETRSWVRSAAAPAAVAAGSVAVAEAEGSRSASGCQLRAAS